MSKSWILKESIFSDDDLYINKCESYENSLPCEKKYVSTGEFYDEAG